MDPLLHQIALNKKKAPRKDKAKWERMEDQRCEQLNAESRKIGSPHYRYVRLWRAVLAEIVTNYHEYDINPIKAKENASIYDFIPTRDFEVVCRYAECDPEYIRDKLKKHRLSENWHRDLESIKREWLEANGYDIG